MPISCPPTPCQQVAFPNRDTEPLSFQPAQSTGPAKLRKTSQCAPLHPSVDLRLLSSHPNWESPSPSPYSSRVGQLSPWLPSARLLSPSPSPNWTEVPIVSQSAPQRHPHFTAGAGRESPTLSRSTRSFSSSSSRRAAPISSCSRRFSCAHTTQSCGRAQCRPSPASSGLPGLPGLPGRPPAGGGRRALTQQREGRGGVGRDQAAAP